MSWWHAGQILIRFTGQQIWPMGEVEIMKKIAVGGCR
jgi:hypothetical protein